MATQLPWMIRRRLTSSDIARRRGDRPVGNLTVKWRDKADPTEKEALLNIITLGG
jgi:hypothetical protein